MPGNILVIFVIGFDAPLRLGKQECGVVYETQLSRLGSADQLRLLALLANGLTRSVAAPAEDAHSLLELEGLGAEVWQGPNGQPVDAQQYVNQLRNEWEQRP